MKANTRSKEEKSLAPFPTLEKKGSLPFGNEKVKNLRSNNLQPFPSVPLGQSRAARPQCHSRTDPKKHMLSSCNNRSGEVEVKEVEAGWGHHMTS